MNPREPFTQPDILVCELSYPLVGEFQTPAEGGVRSAGDYPRRRGPVRSIQLLQEVQQIRLGVEPGARDACHSGKLGDGGRLPGFA